MKKGRPGLTISALCHARDRAKIGEAMLAETTSIGVRYQQVSRLERPRSVELVDTAFGPVPVKVSRGPFGPPQLKPEFDRAAELARQHGVAVRVVLDAAQRAAAARFG